MMTAPGAPLTGLAVPFRTPPRPSPSHHTASDHTTELASASLSVGRQAIPRPSASWMNAKIALVAVGWSAMIRADQVIGSAMIAREIRMRPDRAEAIKYAGMLHDVGKLGVPTKVLQKTGKLTEEEYAAIQLHPMRGLDIVREIGFLDEALAGIMHHHERIDGRGYPMGLAGDEIPEFARVLAVADAFDSMTSTRSYRGARPTSEAVAELRKWSGTQFDPAFVDAFVAAIKRDGWQRPEPPVVTAGEPNIAAQDHDDPSAPLRVSDSL